MEKLKTISTLQYMGSKTRMVQSICEPIISNNSIDTVIDLFAGTGTIAYALNDYYDIVSNDLEQYAYVLNEGILNGCFITEQGLEAFYLSVNKTLDKVLSKIHDAVDAEARHLNMDQSAYEAYSRFCTNTPSVISLKDDTNELYELLALAKQVIPGQVKQSVEVPALFITYYSNAYFGIRQCAEIDAIRYEIEKVKDARIRNVLLSALMTAMSTLASTTTHFAQFLKINGPSSFENIKQKRQASIFSTFKSVVNDFSQKGLLSRRHPSTACYNLDYLELLNSVPLDETVMVYADPPYFKEHYSRYYHVLNTVCKYDYPEIAINPQTSDYTTGRYRVNRTASAFGKKKTALSAFEELIKACARNNAWLTISYSDNSIVKIEEILSIMQKHYAVDTIHLSLSHSNQGRESVSKVEEYLFSGKPLRTRPVVGQKQVRTLLDTLSGMTPLTDTPAGFLHNYMARKPYNIVSAIIANLCPVDGVVYDPMTGSGTTLIEASKQGRTAIGTDINPMAYKLTTISLKSWQIEKVKKVLDDFVESVSQRCGDLYSYSEADNKEVRIIERCHFDKDEHDSRKLIPVEYWYKTQLDQKLSGRKKAPATQQFKEKYDSYQNATIENVSNRALIPNSRIAIYQGEGVYDYFCARNLIALDIIIEELKKRRHKYGYDVLELLVSSAINLIKLSDKKASSQMPYWTPAHGTTSRNAVFVLQQKKKRFLEGLQYLSENCVSRIVSSYKEAVDLHGVIMRDVPAQKISYAILPKDSVDLVVTDPPYTDQVPYLEYSQLWSLILGWNGIEEKRMSEELVVSDAAIRNKDVEEFNRIFEKILKRTSASLKDGGHFVMFYHSFDLKSWDSILKTMRKHGFAYQGQAPIGAPRKSFKTVMSPNSTLDGNYVIVFRKRKMNAAVFDGSISDAENRAKECAGNIIANNTDVTTQMLYDNGMLKDAVEHGYLSLLADRYKTFADVIENDFSFMDGYWRN